MKKVLSLVLASLVLVSVLAGCGSKPAENQNPSQEPVVTPPISGAPQTTAEYQTAMGEFMAAFGAIVDGNFAALVGAVEAGNPEDFAAWASEFDAVEAEVLAEMENLALASFGETDENTERYIEIAVAAADVTNALANFKSAVELASEGDMAEFEAGREAFVSEAKAAIEAWNAITE